MRHPLAETLRHLRIEHKLSQKELANKLFVDRSSIANWENGRRIPDESTIARIADIFEVDVSSLLALEEPKGKKTHIILVDDENIILSGEQKLMEETLPNAVISGFLRASEALAFAKDHRVSIAFLDIEMGHISGLDLCEELLKLNPHTNVIFLTAFADYSLNAWETGASGFELKPLSPEKIQRQLSKLRFPVRGLI